MGDEEGQIAKAKKLQEDKKRTVSYLKSRVEELDGKLAQNYAKGNFALAADDAKQMVLHLQLLSNIDLTQ